MSSDQEFVEFVVGQIDSKNPLSWRKMFGEYAIYCQGKIVALICDNRLFIKPTAGGKKFAGTISEGAPYPGARPAFLVDDKIDDREWLSEMIRITTAELPEPVAKKKKTPKNNS